MSTLPTGPIQSPPFTCISLSSTTFAILYQSSTDTTLWMIQSSDGVNWAPLTHYSDISTKSAVAAAWVGFGDRPLWIVYLAAGGNSLSLLQTNSSATAFAPVVTLPSNVQTVVSPASAIFKSQVIVVYLDTTSPDTDANLMVTNTPWPATSINPIWSAPQPMLLSKQPIAAISTPALAVLGNMLYMAYQTGPTIQVLQSSDGISWSPTAGTPTVRTTCSPSLNAANGTLWLVSLAQPLVPFVSKSSDEGKTWTTTQPPANATTPYSPVTAVIGDRLFIIYASSSDNTIWIISTTDGVNWAGPGQLPPEGVTFGIG